jgi:hypothetical protein
MTVAASAGRFAAIVMPKGGWGVAVVAANQNLSQNPRRLRRAFWTARTTCRGF